MAVIEIGDEGRNPAVRAGVEDRAEAREHGELREGRSPSEHDAPVATPKRNARNNRGPWGRRAAPEAPRNPGPRLLPRDVVSEEMWTAMWDQNPDAENDEWFYPLIATLVNSGAC